MLVTFNGERRSQAPDQGAMSAAPCSLGDPGERGGAGSGWTSPRCRAAVAVAPGRGGRSSCWPPGDASALPRSACAVPEVSPLARHPSPGFPERLFRHRSRSRAPSQQHGFPGPAGHRQSSPMRPSRRPVLTSPCSRVPGFSDSELSRWGGRGELGKNGKAFSTAGSRPSAPGLCRTHSSSWGEPGGTGP